MNARDGIRFSGTLTLPENPEAAVILISGSGPQDRNQLYMGHKTFLVLADYLSRHNIAVLRYDDRGVGQSEGTFDTATSYDFAHDASAAIDYLKGVPELKGVKVGAIGHSEGGLIAPVLANNNSNVDFIVLLAGPSRSGKFVSENQMRKILMSNGVSESTAIAGSQITAALNNTVLAFNTLPANELKQKLIDVYAQKWQQLPEAAQNELRRLGGGSLPDARITMLMSDWNLAFLQHQPKEHLSALKVPLLSLYASKDVQISAEDHYDAMQTAIKRNQHTHSKVAILENHNHLFQTSETGAMAEYQHIEETMSEQTLTTIEQWIGVLE